MNNNYHHRPSVQNDTATNDNEDAKIEQMSLSSSTYVRPPSLSEMIRESIQREDLFADDEDDEKRAKEFYDLLESFKTPREDPSIRTSPPTPKQKTILKHNELNKDLFVLKEDQTHDNDGEQAHQVEPSSSGLTEQEEFENRMMMDEDPKEPELTAPTIETIDPVVRQPAPETAKLIPGKTLDDDARDLCIRPASHRRSSFMIPQEPTTGDSVKKKRSMRRKSSLVSFETSTSAKEVNPSSNSSINSSQSNNSRVLRLPPPSSDGRLYYGPAAHVSRSTPKWRYVHKPSSALFTTQDVNQHSVSSLSASSTNSSVYSYVSQYSNQAPSNSSCSMAVGSSAFSSPESLRKGMVRTSPNALSFERRVALKESAIRSMRHQRYS